MLYFQSALITLAGIAAVLLTLAFPEAGPGL